MKTGTKQAFEPRWQQPATARTAEQWAADQTSDDALNTGLLTNGMRAIDIDVQDELLSAYVVGQCRAILGAAPRRFRQGSGSCMLFYRSSKASPKPVMLMGSLGKVEARANGQQAVIYGIHEGSGSLYQWDSELTAIPRRALTEVSDEQVQQLFDAIYQQIGAPSPASKLAEVQLPSATSPEAAATPAISKRDAANARAY